MNRPAYRFAENASSNNSNNYGNFILRRGAGEIRKPTWSRTETVIRILPCWNFSENRWEPMRYSQEPLSFSDWIRCYSAVRGFGESGITMLLNDPVMNPAYDLQSNPCVLLYRAISQSIDARQCEPSWPALLKGGPNRRAPLSRNQPIYLVRCGIFRIKSKDMATEDRSPLGLANTDPCYFMELPKTAGEKLIAMLEERNEEVQSDDLNAIFKYGDIVSLDQGAYVHFFEEGADPRQDQAYNANSAPKQLTVGSGGRGNYASGGGASQFKGFDLYIEKTWKGYSASLNTPDVERLIKSKQKPWEDSLQFYSHQEQAFLVQDGFPASAILYAWKDHPEWIKDETRSKAVGRVSAEVNPVRQTMMPAVTSASTGGYAPSTATKVTPASVDSITSNSKVGGWGNKSNSDETVDSNKDNVVPSGLSENSTSVKTEVSDDRSREARALAALEAARARNAGRS